VITLEDVLTIARAGYPHATAHFDDLIAKIIVLVPRDEALENPDGSGRLMARLFELDPRATVMLETVGSKADASDPETHATALSDLAYVYPAEVLANPALELLSLSDPAAWRRIVEQAHAAHDAHALNELAGKRWREVYTKP
jgi:hypothetical protein